jgi:large subunit ribosomal protein L24
MNRKRFANKLHVKKGDTVKVLAGDEKGKQGKIVEVFISECKAIVEGLNMKKKHTKPNAQQTQGGIIDIPAPIHVSNLMLVVAGKTTRVGRKIEGEKLVRYAKKTGLVIK